MSQLSDIVGSRLRDRRRHLARERAIRMRAGLSELYDVPLLVMVQFTLFERTQICSELTSRYQEE